MHDGGSVKNDRFLFSWCDGLECRCGVNADFQIGHAIVEWQVHHKIASSVFRRGEIGDQVGFDLLFAWFEDGSPLPLVLAVFCVEIDAANSGSRHVGHGESFFRQVVFDANRWGVGFESNGHSG